MGKRTKLYIVTAISSSLALILSFFLIRSIVRNISYKPLNRCFITSVSKAQLCSASASYVSLNQISPYFIESVIVSEDDKFFMHNGVDWKELKNSMWLNLKHFSYKRGGSTITQQLVKNAYLSQEKSITRKIKELAIAYDIENKYPKKLILEKYLNAIEYGRDLWGIKKASKFYFKKEPSELGVLESLYLTILLPNPKNYSQSFRDKKLTYYQKNRIKILLKRLVRKKVVDSDYAKILLDDIDGFPWGIEESEFIDDSLPEAKDLSDPNIDFKDKTEEVIKNIKDDGDLNELPEKIEIKDGEILKEKDPIDNDLSEEEAINNFLKTQEDQD